MRLETNTRKIRNPKDPSLEPALYIVATPIGNLGDLSARAREVLTAADVIAAEDTRRTGQLLSHEGIQGRLQAYHEHSLASDAARLVRRIADGGIVALVSDAGTPTIADPGYRLVRAVQDEGLPVVPVPGACAVIAALSASGLPSDRFSFQGFLPNRGEARRRKLDALLNVDTTLVFYEAPHRLEESLGDMRDAFGAEREGALARELTKRFETIRRATLGELVAWVAADTDQRRGELVILVAPSSESPSVILDPALGELLRGMAQHMPARQAAKLVAAYAGTGARDLYDYLLKVRDPERDP